MISGRHLGVGPLRTFEGSVNATQDFAEAVIHLMKQIRAANVGGVDRVAVQEHLPNVYFASLLIQPFSIDTARALVQRRRDGARAKRYRD